MWKPRYLKTLWASTASYRDSFILPLLLNEYEIRFRLTNFKLANDIQGMCNFVQGNITTNNSIFWNITQCSPLKVDRYFGGNIASILRVKPAWKKMVIYCSSHSSALNIKTCSSETSLHFHTTRSHIPEDRTFHNFDSGNLRSYRNHYYIRPLGRGLEEPLRSWKAYRDEPCENYSGLAGCRVQIPDKFTGSSVRLWTKDAGCPPSHLQHPAYTLDSW
jgi:hypothetical protein